MGEIKSGGSNSLLKGKDGQNAFRGGLKKGDMGSCAPGAENLMTPKVEKFPPRATKLRKALFKETPTLGKAFWKWPFFTPRETPILCGSLTREGGKKEGAV